jgi:hypothetical protein
MKTLNRLLILVFLLFLFSCVKNNDDTQKDYRENFMGTYKCNLFGNSINNNINTEIPVSIDTISVEKAEDSLIIIMNKKIFVNKNGEFHNLTAPSTDYFTLTGYFKNDSIVFEFYQANLSGGSYLFYKGYKL